MEESKPARLTSETPRNLAVDIVIEEAPEQGERPVRIDENITLLNTDAKKVLSHEPSQYSSRPRAAPGQRNCVVPNKHVLSLDISRLIVKKHIDTSPKGVTPENLMEIARDLGLKLSHQQASQAIFFFKGGKMARVISLKPPESEEEEKRRQVDKKPIMMSPEEKMEAIRKNPHFDKLVEWFVLNIPSLKQVQSSLTISGVDSPSPIKASSAFSTKYNKGRLTQRFGFAQALITQGSDAEDTRRQRGASSGDFASRFNKGQFQKYKRRLDLSEGFKHQVDKYLKDIEALPPLKKQLNSTFTNIGYAIVDNKASFGNGAQDRAKMRLRSTYKQREDLIQNNLNDIILNEPDALHATNLYYLLNKRWLEYPNSYKLTTKLSPRDDRRIKDLLNKRTIT